MADKINIMGCYRSYVYEPKESKWETNDMLNCMHRVNACVVDDVLYYYDRFMNTLRAYDPNQKSWRVVEGVQELLAKTKGSKCLYTVRYGGNMAFLFSKAFSVKQVRFGVQRFRWKKVKEGRFGVKLSGVIMF